MAATSAAYMYYILFLCVCACVCVIYKVGDGHKVCVIGRSAMSRHDGKEEEDKKLSNEIE